jgi:hypothetical protein
MSGYSVLATVLVMVLVVLVFRLSKAVAQLSQKRGRLEAELAAREAAARDMQIQLNELQREADSLRPFNLVRDAAAEAAKIIHDAQQVSVQTAAQAEQALAETRREVKEKRDAIQQQLVQAGEQAAKIIDDAKKQAEVVAGDAYRALKEADSLKATVSGIKNVIEGYGDRYIVPTHSLLDDLAEGFSHMDAGRELKLARERVRLMVVQGRAAACSYVEPIRRDAAIRFVTDAFNGKIDSIFTRIKVDNYGTLEQEVRDAAALVDFNGSAFKDAHIKPEYVDARLDELKWATRLHELREQEKEVQRRIREQIREEEQARREYERAMKEAAREEEIVRKALEKAQTMLLKATDDQRQTYERQINELNTRLAEAEVKNQRALSMAQQTRAGHVYVISNIGSFGENIYKVGMTRRLEPLDRVKELGDASVPFNFDVHAMIWSDDAPGLETTLHRELVQAQVNKVNPRKEFFKVSVADIRKAVEKMGLEVSWTMTAAAADYRESLAIERKISTDEIARQAWISGQMAYEAEASEDEDAEATATSA